MTPLQFDISDDDIKWFRNSLLSWSRKNYFDYPWRSCQSPIHQLISEILLQRTKAEQVVPVFQEVMVNHPSLDSLIMLSEVDFSEIIRPLGLHWRAPLLHRLVQTIKNDFNGSIPEDEKQLERLPGVGPYVSSAYLSLHRNKRAVIIDSNVVRVYARFYGFSFDAETRRKKWLRDLANRITPQREFRKFNYALLDFAKEICKANPLCAICSLNSRCKYAQQNQQ